MVNESLNFKDFFKRYGKGYTRLWLENDVDTWICMNDLYIAFKERFATELLNDLLERLSIVDNKEYAIREMIKRIKDAN